MSAQLSTDHRFVVRETPPWDGRQPVMERLRRAETRLRLVAIIVHSFELGSGQNGSLTGRGSRGVSLPQQPPILQASSDSVVDASPTSSLIELSGSGAGAADMWAARANSRAELREGRRLARSESARRMQQVRMFCGKAIVRTAHWTERETGPELDESVVKPNNLI